MTLLLDRRSILISMAAIAASTNVVLAQETVHTVEMLTKHPEDKKQRNIFLPLIQVSEPGETIFFKPTDKSHNSESIKGMIPDGAEPWKSKINKEYSLTLTQPGIYGYRCTPHAALGMVGLIIVRGDGMTDNLEAAKAVKQRGKAKKVWEQIWAQVESENLLA
ncbi:MAG: pseudoazurin [Pseudomonadota bacterium]